MGEHRAVPGQLTGHAADHRVRAVLAVGIPAILIRERRLAADERLSREFDLAGLSAVLTEVSATPPR
jgi:hypothetical protein